MKKHLKTITVPKSWKIKRKGNKFIIRPLPSKKFMFSVPLSFVFKEILKYCKTTNEVKSILKDNEILIDGRRKKELKDLIGFMDVLSIPVNNEYYRLLLNRHKKLFLMPIDKSESDLKISKIIGKMTIKKGITQLNLFDSRNILINEDKYNVGDSLLIKVPTQEIINFFTLEKGTYVFVISGKHAGEHGTIVNINEDQVTIKTKETEFITPKNSLYIIGKNKPEIKVE